MCGVIEVSLGVWMWHACWVSSDNVEVGTCIHSSLAVPLYLQDTHRMELDVDVVQNNTPLSQSNVITRQMK